MWRSVPAVGRLAAILGVLLISCWLHAAAVHAAPVLLRSLSPEMMVSSVSVSPDGRLVAATCEHYVRLWDLSTGLEVRSLLAAPEHYTVYQVAFSPDGETLAAMRTDGKLTLWDTATWAERPFRVAGDAACFAFSSHAAQIAVAMHSRAINLWDYRSLKFIGAFYDCPTEPIDLAFSADGAMLAAAVFPYSYSNPNYEVHDVLVWDTQTFQLRYRTGESATSLAFAPSTQFLASVGPDNDARLRDARTGTLLRELQGTDLHHKAVAVSPDGRLIAAGGQCCEVWSAETGAILFRLSAEIEVLDVAFSPDGQKLIVSRDTTIEIWDVGSLYSAPANASTPVSAAPGTPQETEEREAVSRLYTGESLSGSLIAALAGALEQMTADLGEGGVADALVQWEVVDITGVYGGIAGLSTVRVTIRATRSPTW